MTAFLLSWKEGILFASLIIFLFTPWSRSLSRYIMLGLFIYLLNKPLISNFHPGDLEWWLGDPAAWTIAATWLGAMVFFVRWLQGIKGQGMWSTLSEDSWSPHLITIALIPLALFLVNLPAVSPHFKTQPDYSFAVLLATAPIQYFIGFPLLRFHDGAIKNPPSLSLIGLLLCILVVSLLHIPGTISAYKALLQIPPTQEGAAELIKSWAALLKRNKVASIGSIRATAYGRIGDLKLSLGDVDGAQQSYQRTLREAPEDITAQIGLARLLIEQGRQWEAREIFQREIEHNSFHLYKGLENVFPPFQYKEILILAEAWEVEGRQEEAIGVYRQALHMTPQNSMVNFRLGRLYFTQGDYDKAIAAFQKTLAVAPWHLCGLSYLIDIYEDEGKGDLARQYRDFASKLVLIRILPSDWQGKDGGILYGEGGCYAQIKLSQGRVFFKIYARGDPAKGVWPHMVVLLNEDIIGEADVTSQEFRPYCFSKDVEKGIYRLWIYFTNDFYSVTEIEGKKIMEDRNLFVEDVEITSVR
jgi:tetratricopeptide (TPR) repeat protein